MLTAGELANGAIAKLSHAHPFQGNGGNVATGGGKATPPSRFHHPAHHYYIPHRCRIAPINLRSLGHVGNLTQPIHQGQTLVGSAAVGCGHQTQHRFNQGALTGTIGANDAHQASRFDGKIDIAQGLDAAVLDAELAHGQLGLGCKLGGAGMPVGRGSLLGSSSRELQRLH